MRRHGLPRSRGIFRQYRRSQSGVTAIEFAMVAPPFFALMMAIFEVGIMLFSEYVIEHGVGKASRMIRTGEVQTAPMGPRSSGPWSAATSPATSTARRSCISMCARSANFDDVILPAPLTEEGELSADVTTNSQFDSRRSDQVVVVRVYYAWSLFAPGMTYMANMSDGRRLLAAGAAFRNEPYAK
jgi:Flp pilus assembly protein TadG